MNDLCLVFEMYFSFPKNKNTNIYPHFGKKHSDLGFTCIY